VLGFLHAAREGNNQLAAQYLNTRLKDEAAGELARQLFVVLDHRLPARLDQLSDQPEAPDSYPSLSHSLVGTIDSQNGAVDIVLEHLDRGKPGFLWLFSRKTLDAIPDLYEEVDAVNPDNVLPSFLVTRFAGIAAFEWLAVFAGIPLFYLLTVLLDRLLKVMVNLALRLWGKPKLTIDQLIPTPVRLLLLALTIHWLLSRTNLSLVARQFWSSSASVIAIVGCVWLLILGSQRAEGYARRHLRSHNLAGATTLLRLARRMLDVVIVFAGLLVSLRYFGVNPTAALAGLGVGGVAVALATQKTLENLIGGISILSDNAVQVGDTLTAGDITGVVEDISLRSTRIRTLARTQVSVPNGQLANMSIETIRSRDKFLLNPVLGLRFGTTSLQMQRVLDGIRSFLSQNPDVEANSVRVRFLRLGPSSLDVEVFAYVFASDRDRFLEIQGGLLLHIMECVESAGTQIAFPSQSIFLASAVDKADIPESSKVTAPNQKFLEEASRR
jgi:MscS family membrane protein